MASPATQDSEVITFCKRSDSGEGRLEQGSGAKK